MIDKEEFGDVVDLIKPEVIVLGKEYENTLNKDFSEDLTLGIDYFVNDAFSCSHRKHSSTVGVTNFLPSFMGTHLEKEIKALKSVLNNPNKPVAAIIGGSKVSTKINVLSKPRCSGKKE